MIVPIESTEYVYNNVKSNTNILVNISKVPHECFTSKKNIEVKNIIKEFLIKKCKKTKEIINL